MGRIVERVDRVHELVELVQTEREFGRTVPEQPVVGILVVGGRDDRERSRFRDRAAVGFCTHVGASWLPGHSS